VAGNLVFLSGMLPTDASGAVVGGGIKVQTARVLDNLSALLDQHGSAMAQVAAVTVYLKNPGDFAAMNEVYARYVGERPPARSTFQVAQLPAGALVEIEAVAHV
jgi:2-iminobutanoate/2-iminopropanoate deaminase